MVIISKKFDSTFVDSNVLANWIIVSSALKERKIISEEEKKELLEKLSAPVRNSYFLIEKIGNEKIIQDIFYTSDIALAETITVIREEYRAKSLLDDGIPMRYWSSYRHKVIFPKDVINEIKDVLDDFVKKFINNNKIIKYCRFNIDDVNKLITIYSCNTHDALILATSLNKNCKYFITEDQRLREALKEKKFKKIKLYPSDRFLREFFK